MGGARVEDAVDWQFVFKPVHVVTVTKCNAFPVSAPEEVLMDVNGNLGGLKALRSAKVDVGWVF